jgi:hypothetical protein
MKYEIANLEEQSLETLKTLWQQVFGSPPSTYAYKEFLIQNLAYHKQAKQHGGLNKRTHRRLTQLFESFKENPEYRPPSSKPLLKSGTRLVREWQGKAYTVTVTGKTFEYLGHEYKNLSIIASLITGTRWSGPAFFGLKRSAQHD